MRWILRISLLAVWGMAALLVWVSSPIWSSGPAFQRDQLFAHDPPRYEELPLAYTMALVAVEDPTFWTHRGLGLNRVAQAMADNLVKGRVAQGGSTLTQQVARMVFESRRRHHEIGDAMRLEHHLEKGEILALYADNFFVTQERYGLSFAAWYFFDKLPAELAVEESAFLAGYAQAPSRYNALRKPERLEVAHQRAEYVLSRLADAPLARLVGPRDDREAALALGALLQDEARLLSQQSFVLAFRDEDPELPLELGVCHGR